MHTENAEQWVSERRALVGGVRILVRDTQVPAEAEGRAADSSGPRTNRHMVAKPTQGIGLISAGVTCRPISRQLS